MWPTFVQLGPDTFSVEVVYHIANQKSSTSALRFSLPGEGPIFAAIFQKRKNICRRQKTFTETALILALRHGQF